MRIYVVLIVKSLAPLTLTQFLLNTFCSKLSEFLQGIQSRMFNCLKYSECCKRPTNPRTSKILAICNLHKILESTLYTEIWSTCSTFSDEVNQAKNESIFFLSSDCISTLFLSRNHIFYSRIFIIWMQTFIFFSSKQLFVACWSQKNLLHWTSIQVFDAQNSSSNMYISAGFQRLSQVLKTK